MGACYSDCQIVRANAINTMMNESRARRLGQQLTSIADRRFCQIYCIMCSDMKPLDLGKSRLIL